MKYVHGGVICKDFLFREDPKEKYLPMCDEFFVKHDLNIEIIGSVCIDGTPDMLGNNLIFLALLKQEILNL